MGSAGTVALALLAGGCVLAAALAWAFAVLLVPGAAPAGPAAWWPGIAALAIAAMGPGVLAAWQHRLPRRRNARRRWSWLPRVVFEVTVGAAAFPQCTSGSRACCSPLRPCPAADRLSCCRRQRFAAAAGRR